MTRQGAPLRCPAGRAGVLAVLAGLVLALASSAGAAPATTRKVVVMTSGSRIEVTRAWVADDQVHMEMAGGAEIVVPQSRVRRISSAAEDLPPVMASTVVGGGTIPASSTTANASWGATSEPQPGSRKAVSIPVAEHVTVTAAAADTRNVAGGFMAGVKPGRGVWGRYLSRVAPREQRGASHESGQD